MKRLIVSLMVVAGALSSACTEEVEFAQSAGLAGTYDVALVSYPPREGETRGSEMLFVTSTDNNELRVLSLAAEPVERQFLRAPNPLQPLAIPVLPRPQALTRDVRYDGNGAEQSGRLVFARSSGSTLISVVNADMDVLKEVRRLDTRQMTGSSVGPVTAFAARAAEQDTGRTTLYFATQETTGARLWRAELPPRQDLATEQGVTAVPLPGVELPPNVAVNSLLVLPPVGAAQREALAVATRGAAGTVYRVVLGTEGTATEVQELNFGGAQVLQLATHGRVGYKLVRRLPDGTRVEDPEDTVVQAGSRIFGILDPSSCGVLLQCTGVLAVDVTTGQVAKDASARDPEGNIAFVHEMLPINAGSGLPTGLSVATNRNLSVAGGEAADRFQVGDNAPNRQRNLTLPVLGIVPLSNGAILFFDGLRMMHINVNALWDTAQNQRENTATASVSFINAQGASFTASTTELGDIVIRQGVSGGVQQDLTFGVTRDETYLLTFQGLLPDMVSVARNKKNNDAFEVPFAPRPGKGQVVQVGDLIILLEARTGGRVCATAVPVLSVQAPPVGGTLATLTPSGPLPAECERFEFFQVRAAGPQPLVLSSSTEDYIARLGGGDTYQIRGPYFFHPPGYQGQTEGVVLGLRVAKTDLNLARGERYVITTDAHFFPYLVSVAQVEDLFFFRLPGPVVQATVGPENNPRDYAYIAYPSANGVLEVDLSGITAGVANSNGLSTFQ